jgi:hypothetical protein
MQKTIMTPRLKMTLIEDLAIGSADLDAVFRIRSDPEATKWRYEQPYYKFQVHF